MLKTGEAGRVKARRGGAKARATAVPRRLPASETRRSTRARQLVALPSHRGRATNGGKAEAVQSRQPGKSHRVDSLLAVEILKPRVLGDVANAESLHALQTRLLAGAQRHVRRIRSRATWRLS